MKHLDNDVFEKKVDESTLNKIAPGEIIIGLLQCLSNQGEPLVSFAENKSSEPVLALSTIPLKQLHSGRQVALLFAQGDLSKPVIIGLIHSPLHEMMDSFEIVATNESSTEMNAIDDKYAANKMNDVYLDGERLVLEGKKEIVLKCGDSSITLTKAGKILIRGKYLLNRSAGLNRILGGSVQIN